MKRENIYVIVIFHIGKRGGGGGKESIFIICKGYISKEGGGKGGRGALQTEQHISCNDHISKGGDRLKKSYDA